MQRHSYPTRARVSGTFPMRNRGIQVEPLLSSYYFPPEDSQSTFPYAAEPGPPRESWLAGWAFLGEVVSTSSWQSSPRSALIIIVCVCFSLCSSLICSSWPGLLSGRLKTPGHRSVVMGYVRGSISPHCHNLYSVPCCGATITSHGVTGFFCFREKRRSCGVILGMRKAFT